MNALTRYGIIWAWLIMIAVTSARADEEVEVVDAPNMFRKAVLIRFEGVIYPLTERRFLRRLDQAKQQGADLVIVEFESPGGELKASERLAKQLLAVDWAKTVAFVPDYALSGAAMASLGCEDIVMAPTARLGDIGVIFQENFFTFRYAEAKIQSDVAVILRDLAVANGRSPALAEAMVDKDMEVYECTHKESGETVYMTDADLAASDNPDDWEKGKLIIESRQNRFLEVNGERAVELGLADAMVKSREQLKERYSWDGNLIVLGPNSVDTALIYLNSGWIMALLIIVGMAGLLVELSSPGIGVGGLLAGLCFTLIFWSHFLGGTAGWLEVVMFLVGIVFILMELFVIPGFGVAGILGLLLVGGSLVLAGQDFIIPGTSGEMATSLQSLAIVIGAGMAFVLFVIGFTTWYGSVPMLDHMTLAPPTHSSDKDAEADSKEPTVGSDDSPPVQVGDWGVADSPLRPAGKAIFGDDFIDVVTEGSFVDRGQQVRIIKISGNRIVVREIDSPSMS